MLAAVMRDDQYFPVQGLYGSTWRGDVEHAGGGTVIEHSIHDVDVLRMDARRPGRGLRRAPRARFGYPGIEDTAAATFTYADGSVAQLTSIWHQVLSRESSRRIEVFCEKALLWTDDDYLGPLHVETDDGEHLVEAEPPSLEQPASPCPRCTRRRWRSTPSRRRRSSMHWPSSGPIRAATVRARRARPVGHPGAADALAAHRLVDLVYRSAADGGVPKSVS